MTTLTVTEVRSRSIIWSWVSVTTATLQIDPPHSARLTQGRAGLPVQAVPSAGQTPQLGLGPGSPRSVGLASGPPLWQSCHTDSHQRSHTSSPRPHPAHILALLTLIVVLVGNVLKYLSVY